MNTDHPPLHLQAAAQALLHARHTHQWAEHALLVQSATEAYLVNDLVAIALGWQGDDAAFYWKSGGPTREVEPTHAALDPQGIWPSPAQAPRCPLHHAGVEAEMALRLGCDVNAELANRLTHATAPHLVEAVCAAIEVVSSRLARPDQTTPWDRMADAQSHGALVLGPWVPCTPDRMTDWARQSGELQLDGQLPKRFTGTHPLGDPFWVLPTWLRHATRHGQVVRAGTVVTTGNWSGHTPVERGQRVRVRFDGWGEAVVQL